MTEKDDFDLKDFLPYLLNQAAEETSRKFEPCYKAQYGMLRTEWRVIFHLGRYGKLTAKDICVRARMHKTKVSRAVQSLESKGYLQRQRSVDDRRHELLALTAIGDSVFADLFEEAQQFDANLMSKFTADDQKALRRILTAIADI